MFPIHLQFPTSPPNYSWEELMSLALAQAYKAKLAAEVPVGAIIITATGTILATAHNNPCTAHDPTAHAEIVAIRQAGQVLGNYRLNNCLLVVTLEPCLMCLGAIVQARLAGVVYGASDLKAGAVSSCIDGFTLPWLNHRPWFLGGILESQCSAILHDFFRID